MDAEKDPDSTPTLGLGQGSERPTVSAGRSLDSPNSPVVTPSCGSQGSVEDPLAHSQDASRRRIGKYEIISELGRGGMGIVFKAKHVELGKTVALKTLLPGAAATPEEVRRFHQEAKAAAELSGSQVQGSRGHQR